MEVVTENERISVLPSVEIEQIGIVMSFILERSYGDNNISCGGPEECARSNGVAHVWHAGSRLAGKSAANNNSITIQGRHFSGQPCRQISI